MTSYLTFVHALSSLYPGTGQGSGVIDLPIAREKATGLPYLPGSSLKGTLRGRCPESIEILSQNGNRKQISRAQVFGSEATTLGETSPGCVQISDQRLLLLPVRSLAGTFAWVTSPYVLRRLARELQGLGLGKMKVPTITEGEQARVVNENTTGEGQVDSCQLIIDNKSRIYLEDLDLQPVPDPDVRTWADWIGAQIFDDPEWRAMLRQRLCVVHDDVLSFLLKAATEIIARIRLEEESKTVKKGGLWYEEALPAETILSGLALTIPRPKSANGGEEVMDKDIGKVITQLTNGHLQLGGKATIGRGQCRIRMIEGKE